MADGRSIVVLGAGGALGSAICQRLASEPDTRLVIGDISDLAMEQTVAGLPASSIVEKVCVDVSNAAQVKAAVDCAVERFGRLDVLINNAGVLNPNGRIHNLTADDWDRCIRINLMGSVNAIQAAVPAMRSQRSGSIILTASVAGLTAWSHSSPYCVTKAGVIHLAKVAAVEYARDGIRVNAVCPGSFHSAIHDGLPQEAVDAIARKHPLGLGAPEDLVGAYSYLASDASRWTTGSAMVIDGGYSAL